MQFRPIQPFLYSAFLALGIMLGYFLSSGDGGGIPDKLSQVLRLIDKAYVDSVNIKNLTDNAAERIMEELDPHSVYYTAEQAKQANDNLEGSYEGIGIEYAIVEDTMFITGVKKESPAAKAGLTAGMQVLAINSNRVSGVKIHTDTIQKIIRRSPSKNVTLSMKDPKGRVMPDLVVKRASVDLPSVHKGVMLDKGCGYIKIDQFGAETAKDFKKELALLKEKNLSTLILDLRDNGGGYLDAAIKIADEFVDGNELLLYTRGKMKGRTEYRSTTDGLYETGKLYVIINERSASASELLSGALQDLDRATIVGRNSFGKGLVQEPFTLNDGSMIRLTVARYYTPSGRCIQKPYVGGERDAYYEEKGHETHVDSGGSFRTRSGRRVFANSGIQPDLVVSGDTTTLTVSLYPVIKRIYKAPVADSVYKDFTAGNYNQARKRINDFLSKDTTSRYADFVTERLVLMDGFDKYSLPAFLKEDSAVKRILEDL